MLKSFIYTIVLANLLFGSKIIKIDLSKQKLYAIENGEIIFAGSVSTGKSGHRTPRGNYKIIDKEKFHISNKYPEPSGGAKMPYMHRLTNSGIAIHQGYLPGYPASHGCIRVSKNTAKKLWFWTKKGIKVKIYGNPTEYIPRKAKHNKVRKHKKYTSKRKKARKVRRKKVLSNGGYRIVELYDSW